MARRTLKITVALDPRMATLGRIPAIASLLREHSRPLLRIDPLAVASAHDVTSTDTIVRALPARNCTADEDGIPDWTRAT
jgi:hypothetical protein